MVSHSPKKNLRIGVFRGKESVLEQVIKKNHTISFGRHESNTLCVKSSAVPNKTDIFIYNATRGTYTLRVDLGTKGRVTFKDGSSITLENITSSNEKASVVGGKINIELPETARGKVSYGKITVLFQFVTVRDDVKTLLYAGKQRKHLTDVISYGLLIPLIFSSVLHLGFLTFVLVQDWPRDDEVIAVTTRYLREADLKAQVDTEDDEEKPVEEETIEDPTGEPSTTVVEDSIPDPGDSGASKEELLERITDAHREMGAAITAQVLGVEGGDAGEYFGAMLGSSSVIADMADASAADIGLGGTGGLLNSLAAGNGGSGNGLLGLGDGGNGSGGPRVVVDGKDAKSKVERKKVEYKMSDSSEFTASTPADTKTAFNSVFKKNSKNIENCYKRVIDEQGKRSGRLVLMISVGKDGLVVKVEAKEDQIGGSMFSCVRQKIMNLKFGPQKAPITFKKVWVFQ